MPITRRPAAWSDIEPCLAIQPSGRGDALPDVKSALGFWKRLFHDPFFLSSVVESTPPIQAHRLIGFGSAVLVNSNFAEAEFANPRPDITSRIMTSLLTGRSALATWDEVAQANAYDGVHVVIIYNAWRDDILRPEEKKDVKVVFTSSFADVLAGFRVCRILVETTNPASEELHRISPEYQVIAEFPSIGRVIYRMTRESATALPGSLGNLIFKFHPPILRLRNSDQQLLLIALQSATDNELTVELGITFSAVKARWRSIFARVGQVLPDLVIDAEDREGRGKQKRHRVLAYLRTHMEELRPYDWNAMLRRTGEQRVAKTAG